MSSAKITLIGFHNYMLKNNDNLFKNLIIPETLDKETLINNILLRGGEFESLYGNPYFIQNSIGVWSKKWQRTFEKWVKALSIEYDPLYNYDRTEEYTDTIAGTTTNTGTVTDNGNKTNTGTVKDEGKVTNEGTVTDSASYNNSVTGSVTNTRSAYDSSNWENDNKSNSETVTNGVSSNIRTDDLEQNASNTRTDNLTETNTNTRTDNLEQAENRTISHSARLFGNIGVTTSQQMLESELDIAMWNIYEHMTDLFLQEFVLPVY